MKNILNNISVFILFIFIFFMNIGTALISMGRLFFLDFSIYLYIFGIIALILYIITKIVDKECIKLKDIFIMLLLLGGIISYFFSYNKVVAINGMSGRFEGLKSLFSYYSIFLLASKIENKWQKRFMYVLIATGIIQIIIGTFQILEIKQILGYDRSNNFSTNYRFASGTLRNPNFYSTYIVLIFMYVWALFTNCNKKRLVYFALFLIFSYGLIIGNTVGCVLSVVISVFIFSIKKINRNNIKKTIFNFIKIITVLTIMLLVINNFTGNRIGHAISENLNEINNIFKNGLDDSTGNYRIYVWKESIKYIPKYIITGIGIDNFGFLNNGFYFCSPNECFDKAHNEYLQILITEGIFTFVVYLCFMIYVIIRYKKTKHKDEHTIGLFYGFITYLIQAFFNISVIHVAPIFYIYMGFLCSNNSEESVRE